MLRKISLAVLVGSAVFVGLVAQAGSYLLALPTGGTTLTGDGVESGHEYSAPGSHAVGISWSVGEKETPPTTVWYPALEDEAGTITYSYALNMVDTQTSLAVATFTGQANVGASPDRSGAPYPLVVLSHGFAITPSSYGWLAEHLASWGFVVVAPNHSETLDPGALWRSVVDRPADVASVMKSVEKPALTSRELGGMVDSERVAMVGHSLGGYTALAAAGARIDPVAFRDSCHEAYTSDDPLTFLCDALLPRVADIAEASVATSAQEMHGRASLHPKVDAVVTIAGDAAMFGPSGLAEILVPVMSIGGTADVDTPFEWGTHYTYEHVSSDRRVEVALDGATHMTFAGRCDDVRRIIRLLPLGFCGDSGWRHGEVHEVVKASATAFLLAELQDDVGARHALANPILRPNVGYRFEGY